MTTIGTASSPVQWRIDLLGDADPKVRLQVALELGEGRHEESAAALVERFQVERDFHIREALTWAVLRFPEAAMPLVREALSSPRWLPRLQATHTVSKLGFPDDGEQLIPVIADPVDAVAARAYWAATQCGDPVVIPALVGQLSRGSSEQRNSLTVALAGFGTESVPALVGALRHGASEPVRGHAADTLGYLASPAADQAEAALADAVHHDEEAVRMAALNALGQLDTRGAWRVVEETTASLDPRLGLLARRLAERRPSDDRLRAAPESDDLPDSPGPPPGDWPSPDPALVTLEGGPWAEELTPKLALQVEIGRPRYLSRADVPSDTLARVHAETEARAHADGKPDTIAERMAAGRVEQFIHETVLLEQVSAADPGMIVKDLLRGTGVRVTGFVR